MKVNGGEAMTLSGALGKKYQVFRSTARIAAGFRQVFA
jgi:hypothetical protein